MSHLFNWSSEINRVFRGDEWDCARTGYLLTIGKRQIHRLAKIDPVVARSGARYCV